MFSVRSTFWRRFVEWRWIYLDTRRSILTRLGEVFANSMSEDILLRGWNRVKDSFSCKLATRRGPWFLGSAFSDTYRDCSRTLFPQRSRIHFRPETEFFKKSYVKNLQITNKRNLPRILNLALIEVQALDALTVIKTCFVIFILSFSFRSVFRRRESTVTSVVGNIMTLEAKFF